jgi:hypothetical protein
MLSLQVYLPVDRDGIWLDCRPVFSLLDAACFRQEDLVVSVWDEFGAGVRVPRSARAALYACTL